MDEIKIRNVIYEYDFHREFTPSREHINSYRNMIGDANPIPIEELFPTIRQPSAFALSMPFIVQLEKEELQQLRTISLVQVAATTSEEICSICLDNYRDGQNTITLPCKHIFHSECILKWFDSKSTCPYCRMNFN
jgi:hypothetical protein